MSEEKSTNETKEVLDLALGLADVAVKATADGKVDLNDLGLLISLVPKAGPAVDGLGQVPGELANLSEAEAADLVTHVMTKLTVTDEKARKIVEAGLKAAAANFALIQAIKS